MAGVLDDFVAFYQCFSHEQASENWVAVKENTLGYHDGYIYTHLYLLVINRVFEELRPLNPKSYIAPFSESRL